MNRAFNTNMYQTKFSKSVSPPPQNPASVGAPQGLQIQFKRSRADLPGLNPTLRKNAEALDYETLPEDLKEKY